MPITISGEHIGVQHIIAATREFVSEFMRNIEIPPSRTRRFANGSDAVLINTPINLPDASELTSSSLASDLGSELTSAYMPTDAETKRETSATKIIGNATRRTRERASSKVTSLEGSTVELGAKGFSFIYYVGQNGRGSPSSRGDIILDSEATLRG